MSKQDEFYKYVRTGVDESNAAKMAKISPERLLDLKKDAEFCELLDQASATFTCRMMGSVSENLTEPGIAIKALQISAAQKEKDSQMTEDPLGSIFKMIVPNKEEL